MRQTHLLCLLIAVLPLTASAAAQNSLAPSIVGNFSDPQDADRAIFSPDGRILAVSGFRNDLTLWDLSSGLPIRTLPTRAYLTGAVFSNDGQRMLTGHKDGAVRLWDTVSGSVLDALRAKPKDNDTSPTPIIGLSIDRKGEHVITSEFGTAATVWNVPARKFLFTVPRTDNENLSKHQSIAASRFAADGKRLIVLSAKEYQKLYSATTFDALTGAEISFFNLPDNVIAVDDGFVSDDEAIVLVSDECESGEFKLFSLKERAVIAPVYRPAACNKAKDGKESNSLRLFTSPDSSLVVISQEGHPELTIYDTRTRKVERTLRLPAGSRARVIGVSRDLTLAALAETDRIAIHALDTGALVKSLRSVATPVDQLRISPNGADVVSQKERPKGSDAPVTVGIRKLDNPRGTAFTVALPADFTLEDIAAEPRVALAKNETGEIRLISLDGKSAPRSLPIAPLTSVARARLSPDGKIAVLDGIVKNGNGGSTKAETRPGEKNSDKPGEQDSDELTSTFILDLADGKMTEVAIDDKDNEVMSVAFAADGGRFAFGFRDGSAAIFEARSGRILKKLPRYPKGEDDGDAGAIAFSPDGTLLAGGAIFDDKVFVWDIGSGKLMRTMTLPDSLAGYRIVTAVAVSPDRKTLAAGLGHRAISSGDIGREAGGIYLFDLATGKLRHTLRGHTGAITGLTFSKDGKYLVSGSYDGTVRTWDRATGKPVAIAAMDNNGRWSIVTEAGFYSGPDGGDDVLSLVRGTSAVSGAAARSVLSRPDLVEALLKGDPDGKYRAAARALDWSKVAPVR